MKQTAQILFTLALLSIGYRGVVAQSQEEPTPRIQVTGTATISLAPDELTMQIRIHQQNADAKKAVEAYRSAREGVLSTLRKYNVGDTNIIERGLSFSKETERNYETGKIIREYYQASTTIDVVLRKFDAYPDLVIALTGLPGVELGSVGYRSSKEIETRQRARVQAMEAAKKKAETMAAVVGAKLGPPLLITENNPNTPYLPVQSNMMYRNREMDDAESSSALIVSNEAIQIMVSVYVEFELKQ